MHRAVLAVVLVSAVVACGREAVRATTHAHEPRTLAPRTVPLGASGQATTWFAPLHELLEDPARNPRRKALAPADEKLALEAFEQARSALDRLNDRLSQRQHALVRARLEAGDSEPYLPGVSTVHRGPYASVAIASVRGQDLRVVRLTHEEFPEAAGWRAEAATIRDHAYEVLDTLLSESTLALADASR